MTGKEQPAGQDRSRNWSAENLSTTLRCGVTHHGTCSLTDYAQSVPYKLPQRAALPLFDGVCPPVLYSRTFSRAKKIIKAWRCAADLLTIYNEKPSHQWDPSAFFGTGSHSTHGASGSIPPKDLERTFFPVTPQPLTVAELAKFIARFPSGVASSSKTCQHLVINMQARWLSPGFHSQALSQMSNCRGCACFSSCQNLHPISDIFQWLAPLRCSKCFCSWLSLAPLLMFPFLSPILYSFPLLIFHKRWSYCLISSNKISF